MKNQNTKANEWKRVGDKFKGRDVKVAISIRLDPTVLSLIRGEAERMGLPYQTLINSMLTEDIARRLANREHRKAMIGERVRSRKAG